jgi:hypothetical protein
MKGMTPEMVERTIAHRHNPCPFKRLTLTLSKRGWTASVQWQGTIGARGCGDTQEEAILDSIKFAKEKWGTDVSLDGTIIRV